MKSITIAFILLVATIGCVPSARPRAETTAYRRTIERVTSLDPSEASSVYAARCTALIYETLLEYDYDKRPYELVPGLAAEMPRISPDGLTYTFKLHPHSRFQADPCFGLDTDGAPRSRALTAADLVFSFKRLADAKLASPGFWIVDGRVRGIDTFHQASRNSSATDYSLPVEGLRAPDALTFEIELVSPAPPFIWMLAMSYTAAIPHEAVAYYRHLFGENPVGTGPYKLEQWRRNYQMVFAKKNTWHGWDKIRSGYDAPGELPFDRIIFPIIDDPSTQWLAFLNRQLDLQGEIARDSWELVVNPEGELRPEISSRGIQLSTMPTLEVAYIGINMDDPTLGTNSFLRQALNCAFDSPRWSRYYQGRVIPANGAVPPGVAGALTNAPPYSFDLDRARELLAKAGYPGGIDATTGRPLRLSLDLGRTSQDVRESTELIVAFLRRVGIDLVPEYHNWPAFLRKISQRRSQLFRIGWVGDYPDAENFLQLFYSPNQTPGPNRCNYRNPTYDVLYRQAMRTHDESQRLDIYRDLQEIIRADCPWIFIHFAQSYSLNHDRLRNFKPHDFPYGMEKYLRYHPDSVQRP